MKSTLDRKANKLRKGGLASDPVGVPRFHAVYNGLLDAPVLTGPPSRTVTIKAPPPCCGAGKGFRGI